jgi:hypothetical protein
MAAIVIKHSHFLAVPAPQLMFVQRGNAIGVALLAALLGRFLPRLGPLRATEAASFFVARPNFPLWHAQIFIVRAGPSRFALGGADRRFLPRLGRFGQPKGLFLFRV